jgi:hypothetical protein
MARISPSKQNQYRKKKPYKNSTAYWANEIAKVDDGRARIPVELKKGFYNAWKREGKSPQRVYFIWKGTNPYARKGFFQSYGTRSSQRGGDPYQPSYYENNMAKGARRRAKQKQATIELIDYFDEFKKKWPDAPDKDVAQLAQNAFDVDQTYLKIAAGEISPKIHYEHTQPLSKGGLETRINVEMDDADFNVTKGAKEPSELTKSKYNIVSNKGEAIEQSLQSPIVNPRSEEQFVERRTAIRKDLGYSKDITPEAIQAQSNVQQRFGQALDEMEFKTSEQALANIEKVRQKNLAKRLGLLGIGLAGYEAFQQVKAGDFKGAAGTVGHFAADEAVGHIPVIGDMLSPESTAHGTLDEPQRVAQRQQQLEAEREWAVNTLKSVGTSVRDLLFLR